MDYTKFFWRFFFFLVFFTISIRWDYQGSSKTGFYSRDFPKGTTEWKRVQSLFLNHLDGKRFQIKSITAVVSFFIITSLTLSTIKDWFLHSSINGEVLKIEWHWNRTYLTKNGQRSNREEIRSKKFMTKKYQICLGIKAPRFQCFPWSMELNGAPPWTSSRYHISQPADFSDWICSFEYHRWGLVRKGNLFYKLRHIYYYIY